MQRAFIGVTLAGALIGIAAAGRQPRGDAEGTLSGAIDIHVHSAPDSVERSIDSIDVAKLALARGMRAIVLKSHYEPTATMAYIVRKAVPGIGVFGGIDLNPSVRGMNPAPPQTKTHATRDPGGP